MLKSQLLAMARPSDFSEELADRICERLSNGESLRKICRADEMPHRSTVLRWVDVHPSFATKCARARELQGDYAHDEMMDIEDDVLAGKVAPDVARVVISSKQWRASKLAPKKYGDKHETVLSGPNGGPIETLAVDPVEAAKAYQRLIKGE